MNYLKSEHPRSAKFGSNKQHQLSSFPNLTSCLYNYLTKVDVVINFLISGLFKFYLFI